MFPNNLAESLLRAVLVLVFSLFSPAGWLVRQVLSGFLDIDRVVGAGAGSYAELQAQLSALSPDVVAYQLLPALLGCILFCALCLFVSVRLADFLVTVSFPRKRESI